MHFVHTECAHVHSYNNPLLVNLPVSGITLHFHHKMEYSQTYDPDSGHFSTTIDFPPDESITWGKSSPRKSEKPVSRTLVSATFCLEFFTWSTRSVNDEHQEIFCQHCTRFPPIQNLSVNLCFLINKMLFCDT